MLLGMRLRRLIEILGLSLILVFMGCGGQSIEPASTVVESIPNVATTKPIASTTSLSPPTSGALSQQSTVGVYFIKDELLSVIGRLVETPNINEALHSLLLGPTDAEIREGVVSYIPKGTHFLDIKVVGTTALIDVSNEFATGGGSLSMMGRIAEVVYTVPATSFSNANCNRTVAGLEVVRVPAPDLPFVMSLQSLTFPIKLNLELSPDPRDIRNNVCSGFSLVTPLSLEPANDDKKADFSKKFGA